ncbi:hypothetical protein [Rhodoferax sp.]|uniref:hypothetical protein n=1 Tax=Rhodoferax sp. TaxID=50421 RepID=UPI0027472A8E|nr:hypothetical protein [Rhodoferax sp.]
MTYCIRLSVDLSSLATESRSLAQSQVLNRACRLTRPQPFSGHAAPDVTALPMELRVPDDVSGKHAEYGTSIYAAGRAGLELARVELAEAGIGRKELDQLTTADVSIERAAATYIFKFTSPAQTATFQAAMHHHALLLGLTFKYDRQENTVSYRGVISQDSSEVVLTVLRQPANRMIRVEAELDCEYLRARDWTALESWRTAYAENRYAAIFNQTVRELFQLDSPSLPYSEPGRDVLDKLTPTTEGLLREYFDGRDPMWYGRHAVANSEAKRKRLVKGYRNVVIGITGIDIAVPWQQFRWTAPTLLKSKLNYPGDFQPVDSQIAASFCEANWPQLLGTLGRRYQRSSMNGKKR